MYNKTDKHLGLCRPLPINLSRPTPWRGLLILPWLLAPTAGSFAAIPPEWKNTAYAYEAEHKPLREVLEDFAQTFGTQLQVEGLLEGNVNGKIRANTPQSMLDRLGVEHRFQWYLYNNTLYISTLDQQESARLEVSSETLADLKQALTDIGLLDSRFGWGELPEDGVVLVSGPRRYIEQIRQFSSQRRTADEKQSVLSYPLKFANATDRQIEYRSEKITLPGVATMLRGLLEPRSSSTLSGLAQRSTAQSQPAPVMPAFPRLGNPLLGQMLGTNAGTAPVDTGMAITPRAQVNTSRIRVEADVHNNAVLIYDVPERQAMYRELISQLDIARKLVEIDAIILDIERTQLHEFGIKWGFQNSRFRGGVNMEPGTSSQLSIKHRDRFYADVRALESRGLATMVSNPSVLTLENQPAVIDFNRTQYLTAGRENATILPIIVGTSFQVVPRVITSRGGHQIHLAVDIEDGNFDESNPDRLGPDVRRGKVSTQAVMAEKRSLVVGGFHVTESTDKQNKVPLLGDIPLLGKALFSSTERQNNRRERLFILTPRVIGDQSDPSRYLPADDQVELQAALKPLARRLAPHQPVINRSDITSTLAHLVSGEIPKAFKASPMPLALGTLCNTRDLLALNSERGQWYAGPQYNVAVVVVRNQFTRNVRIDEKECSNSQTLAVAVWPNAWLKPGEEAEVFIAMRPVSKDEHLGVPRPSLITPPQKAVR
ncbi:EscC/YscC/HrcC family type III secretion system outer membrane ring protein [Pseudomonas fluorescens]|uniref:type III secretion system outer membrane ring subunit SctC n=1 Tax=Pseudomonas lactucae TaxID=2813360 RepID=UPI0009991796|nr:type III secretion system outer membrane ring subunit SctC [Pseudomonas lactucae]MBN2988011.1 type III secretion system outer membrane ring subunit SctC [Pseudomonas lactucae]OPA97708.1 EscC/YscC/HrcC family type III secretion system outer membrane ring protein [Pseudomonas fluorescens]OPB13709.1 EscC/YscC/HrcC family type III secretion system outer membrane ring protein [Pseudomonas fluorescens]OPB27339.1 EscC/YscC/HrcC family type III secretion system outer membrane ring protein [Pseudomon